MPASQFNLAKTIPGKEEFYETLRYFSRQLEVNGVDTRLNQRVDKEKLESEGFDSIVIAESVWILIWISSFKFTMPSDLLTLQFDPTNVGLAYGCLIVNH